MPGAFIRRGSASRAYRARGFFLSKGATNTYSYTSSGGITFGGSAPVARTFGGNVASGGIVFAGAATIKRTFGGNIASGGIIFAGSATVTRAWLRSGSGGIVFAGSATIKRTQAYAGSGGVTFSGSATVTLILTTPTLAQVESASRNEIFKRFLRETGLGVYGTVTGVGGGATTTFDDTTRLKSAQFTSKDWVGAWARISKNNDAVGTAPENEVMPVTTYDPTTNGRITAPTFTTIGVGDEYELWRFPNPKSVIDDLDTILREDIYLPCWTILSEAPDFDMEQNNTTDWTAGANTTLSKATGEPTLSGAKWLALSSTDNAASAYNANIIGVEPSKNYVVSVVGYGSVAGMELTLEAYDVTNSASIKTVTWDRNYPGRLHMEFTTPSSCKSLRILLRHATGSGSLISYWDELCLYPSDAYDIALPWWVKNKNQVKAIFRLFPTDIDTDVWDSTLRGDFFNDYEIRDNAFGRGQLRLVMSHGGSLPGILFLFGVRNEVAYANDNTDVKRIDENLIIAALACKVFRRLKTFPNSNAMQTTWAENQYKEWEQRYKQLTRQQSSRLEEILRSYQLSGQYIDSRFALNR